jgi:hypothetical protein
MAAAADHRWISTLDSLKLRFGDRDVVVRRRADITGYRRFGFPRALGRPGGNTRIGAAPMILKPFVKRA